MIYEWEKSPPPPRLYLLKNQGAKLSEPLFYYFIILDYLLYLLF
jgi:hypothetical protein